MSSLENRPVVEILNHPNPLHQIVFETSFFDNELYPDGDRRLEIKDYGRNPNIIDRRPFPSENFVWRFTQEFLNINDATQMNKMIYRNAIYKTLDLRKNSKTEQYLSEFEEKIIQCKNHQLRRAREKLKCICNFCSLLYPEISITSEDIKCINLNNEKLNDLISRLSAVDQYYLHHSTSFFSKNKQIAETEKQIIQLTIEIFGSDKDVTTKYRNGNKTTTKGNPISKKIIKNFEKWKSGRKKAKRTKGTILEDKGKKEPTIFL